MEWRGGEWSGGEWIGVGGNGEEFGIVLLLCAAGSGSAEIPSLAFDPSVYVATLVIAIAH